MARTKTTHKNLVVKKSSLRGMEERCSGTTKDAMGGSGLDLTAMAELEATEAA